MVIHAIYEGGVFRPRERVDLPERCEVSFEPRVVEEGKADPSALDALYEIMSRRYNSGHHDTAERHNEHQP